jgi:hypothetical protein
MRWRTDSQAKADQSLFRLWNRRRVQQARRAS